MPHIQSTRGARSPEDGAAYCILWRARVAVTQEKARRRKSEEKNKKEKNTTQQPQRVSQERVLHARPQHVRIIISRYERRRSRRSPHVQTVWLPRTLFAHSALLRLLLFSCSSRVYSTARLHALFLHYYFLNYICAKPSVKIAQTSRHMCNAYICLPFCRCLSLFFFGATCIHHLSHSHNAATAECVCCVHLI